MSSVTVTKRVNRVVVTAPGPQGAAGVSGVSASNNAVLTMWTVSGAYSITSATRDSDGVITTATVSWPDGSAGTFTRTTKNATFLTIDAYTVTHTDSAKTVTQAAVTRDSNGNVTAQPAITVN